MEKKWLSKLGVVLFLTVILLPACKNTELIPLTDKRPQQLPAFTFTTLDGETFTNNDLEAGKNTLLLYLDPECIFCQTAIQRFTRNMDDFEDVQFLIVSTQSQNDLEQFQELHGLAEYPQMILVRDREKFFERTFYAQDYPVLYLYNKEGRYITDFQGLPDLNDVESAFNQY